MVLRSFVRTLPLSVLPLLVLVFALGDLSAQQTGTVTGVVTDARDGRPLSAVQVQLQALQRGVLTNAEGRYTLENVPVGEHELAVERLGYQGTTQTVQVGAGASAAVNFALTMRAISMEGIVATGVASETPRSQLAFTVAQLNVDDIQRVPTPSVGGLLQAKVPGAKVVQGSGMPGQEPSFQFRGPTSITGSQEPLIVIDGVITAGGIADLNTQDIESMEVVKGAAAAALYGSRAQAGVLQITTRSGAQAEGQTRFTLRNSFEMNDIERSLGYNRSHPYQMNEAGTEFLGLDGNPRQLPVGPGELAFDDGGPGTNARRSFADKAFPGQTYDPMGQFFNPGNRLTSNVSIAGNQGGTQYFISAQNIREEGAITLHDPLTQQNVRVNLTQPIGDRFRLSATSFFSNRDRPVLTEQGGLLRQLTFVTAAANLMARDPATGEISHIGDPIRISNVTANPIHRLVNTTDEEHRTRVMGGFDARYEARNWLTFEGNLSYDRIDTNRNQYQRPGLLNLVGPPTVGSMMQNNRLREELNSSFTVASNHRIGDVVIRSRARWLIESQDFSGFSVSGSGLPVNEVPSLGIITGTANIDSFRRSVRSQGAFLINSFSYQDKYMGDFLVRRDGSSLFGEDERWQSYWRVSGAWRMTQEPWFNVSWLNEFKPRYSIGTSGGRPSFDAQYQTYAVDRGQVIPRTLGNRDLKPELATEQEFGLDMVIGQRFSAELNYVDTRVTDQLLLVPLPSMLGFEAQWRNAGAIEATTWELGLEASLIERADMRWTTRLNLDRTRNLITELNVPPYEVTNSGSSRSRMLVQEGEALGSFFGFRFPSSCADLPGVPCSEFDVNDWGHLVWVGEGNTWRDGVSKDLWGTTGTVNGETYQWGHPIRPGPDSPLYFTRLGNSQPSLNASFFQDFEWRNIGVSFLLDSEWGAQVYNMTQQWQCRDALCKLADMAGVEEERKKPITYFGALQGGNSPNDFWTEDADYIKVRELSLRYIMRGNDIPSLLQRAGFTEAVVNLTGRNLKTWTSYRGFDPEVGTDSFGGSAALGRVDEWFHPNFRSLGIDLQLVF